jgi:hypothetical protein
LRFRATIERARDDRPRRVVLPADVVDALALTTTTTVIGTMAGVAFDRQAVKPIPRGGWFVDVTGRVCTKAKVDTGDVIDVELEVIGEEVPPDLAAAIAADEHAQAWWDGASASKRRQAVNSVEKAKTPATRAKRIADHVKLTSDFQRLRTTRG